jgi:hypothetical protein
MSPTQTGEEPVVGRIVALLASAALVVASGIVLQVSVRRHLTS